MGVRFILTAAAVLFLGACRPAAPARVCPSCPTCPITAARDPSAALAVLPAAPPRDRESPSAIADSVDSPVTASPALVTDLATLHVDSYETEGPSSEPLIHVRVRIQPAPTGDMRTLERVTESDCGELEPGVQMIGGDEDTIFVDVRLVCRIGEEIVREIIEHTVVRISRNGDALDSTVIFAGTSRTRDNRRLAVESDRLEFYVEGGRLAVYRHRVAHCDRAALRTTMGPDDPGCSIRKRTLQLVRRI